MGGIIRKSHPLSPQKQGSRIRWDMRGNTPGNTQRNSARTNWILDSVWESGADGSRMEACTSFFLIQKRGRKSSWNYWPIALLSQTRKIIKKVLDWRTRKEYKCREEKCGFLPNKSTETAILRVRMAHRSNRKATVVLDLISTYQSVLRKQLVERIRRKVSCDLSIQIQMILSENIITTVGDMRKSSGRMGRGVPQRSPLSRTLFNIYINELVDEFHKQAILIDIAISLFAEDVLGLAEDKASLQRFLNVCDNWAKESGMQLADNTCISLMTTEDDNQSLHIAGQALREQEEAEYLGISLTFGFFSTNQAVQRTRDSQRTLTLLRRIFKGWICQYHWNSN